MNRAIRMFWVALLTLLSACQGNAADREPGRVGGRCDGCEIMFVGMPEAIGPSDTSAGWTEGSQKLIVRGVIYERDAKTPAAGVVLYYWHTDSRGDYAPSEGMDDKASRHGRLRGWVKTDSSGRYEIRTSRPAPYPNATIPAHIHLTVKEPGLASEYTLDELVFDDDPLLTSGKRHAVEDRGGSGILEVSRSGDVQIAEHDVVLGLNVPNYPAKAR